MDAHRAAFDERLTKLIGDKKNTKMYSREKLDSIILCLKTWGEREKKSSLDYQYKKKCGHTRQSISP